MHHSKFDVVCIRLIFRIEEINRSPWQNITIEYSVMAEEIWDEEVDPRIKVK
jgi:hypothetical protein